MKYLTKSLMQRFMSHMTTNLRDIQAWRNETEEQILWGKRFECRAENHVLLV